MSRKKKAENKIRPLLQFFIKIILFLSCLQYSTVLSLSPLVVDVAEAEGWQHLTTSVPVCGVCLCLRVYTCLCVCVRC